MAGTHYGALNFTFEEEKKPQGTLRKSGAIAAVVVAVCVMFFAGRVHKSLTTPFTHEDVMNVASTCPPNKFIGGCKKCQDCAAYEFPNGGCTWFKDTFCTYCDPISHCNRIEQRCTAGKKKVATTCMKCDCDKPPSAYNQKTLEDIEYYKRTWSVTKQAEYTLKKNIYSCFYNDAMPWTGDKKLQKPKVLKTECRACTVCPNNYFQISVCSPAKHKDTQCRKCRTCLDFQYVAEPCSYNKDTECLNCVNCDIKSKTNKEGKFYFQSKTCSGQKVYKLKGTPNESSSSLNTKIYTKGWPGVCTECSKEGGFPHFWISNPCNPGKYSKKCETVNDKKNPPGKEEKCGYIYEGKAKNTDFKKCAGCQAGEYIGTACKEGITTGATCKPVFNADNNKNCGQYRKGATEVCLPCKKNSGCVKAKGGESCQLGQFLETTDTGSKQLWTFRTRTCDHERAPAPTGDATYGTCDKCAAWEYQRRNCAAECKIFRETGKCAGGAWGPQSNEDCTNDDKCRSRDQAHGVCAGDAWRGVETKKCKYGVKDACKPTDPKLAGQSYHCKQGYCKGQCSLLLGGKKVGSSEDGNMVKNRKGVQVYCESCPNTFVAGKKGHGEPVLRPSRGLQMRCLEKHKVCASYKPAAKKYDANGMTMPPAYATCNGECPSMQSQMDKFANCCQENALGPACEWQRVNRQCRTPFVKAGSRVGMPYRTRTKKAGGYSGFRPKGLVKQSDGSIRRKAKVEEKVGSHVFVRWCKQLCEDFPSCTMFQVKRCLVDGTCKKVDKDGVGDIIADGENKGKVVDKTLCELFKKDSLFPTLDSDKPKPLKKEVLTKLKANRDNWTCEQGFSVYFNHREGDLATAGFKCPGKDATMPKPGVKCGVANCSGADVVKTCCTQNTQVCYTKPRAMHTFQNAR